MAAHERVDWHALEANVVAQRVCVAPTQGLTSTDAAQRLATHGANALPESPPKSALSALLAQFRDVLVLVLLGAAALAFWTGDATDALLILAIVAIDAAIGCAQELRAERAVRSLRGLLPATAAVRRDGAATRIAQRELVVGDIVLLDAGAIVPADLRLFVAHDLSTQEAALTGESLPVRKRTDPIHDAASPIADRPCMAWKGTLVVRGRGEGIVVATGAHTELGRIAQLLEGAEEPPTPLQRQLASFGRRISALVLVTAAALLAAALMRGEALQPAMMLAISVAVAAIPEALPAVVTIALALAARRMAQRNALVRKLPAVETLGAVTYVCTDKTGTLTENCMRVRSVWRDGAVVDALPHYANANDRERALLLAFAISHDAELDGAQFVGDPTETALADAAHRCGAHASSLRAAWPRIAEIPFDASLQRMTTVHRSDRDAGWLALTKGAPEAVLPLCAIDDALRARIEHAAHSFAAGGKRVLAFAQRPGTQHAASPSEWTQRMEFLGLAALEDPPRSEAKAAVARCKAAGIVPVMITGDHPATARSIALELGLIDAEGHVVTGRDLDGLDETHLANELRRAHSHGVAFARTSPEHKIRIVGALQRLGEVVAMTGDGVNDAPALRQANIGVAMGRRGSDVAREASDLALLDDNFATIPAAVEEGRRMHDSVRRFVRFLMTGNSAELLTIVAATALAMPAPLLPVHILWINLVTDGLPGLLLANEPADPCAMQRPPRQPEESLFARGVLRHVLVFGACMAAFSLFAISAARHDGEEEMRTLVFTTLVLCQLAHSLSIRSERLPLFGTSFFCNLPLLATVVLSALVQLLLVYTPIGNRLLHTKPLDATALLYACAAAALIVLGVEVEKWIARRRDSRLTATTSRTR